MRGGTVIAVAAVALLIVATLATIGAPSSRPAPSPVARSSPAPSSVSAAGVTLASTQIVLPDEASSYPPGPHADAVDANCTACHSPAMVLTQPRLTAEQWTSEVTKMRDVYKAPVADRAVPDIVVYLTSLPTQRQPGAAAPVHPKADGPGPG